MKDSLWTLEYADHNGNRYRFWLVPGEKEARFSFDPVSPEQSSSGTYSGGKPKVGTLDAVQVESLFEHVRSLEESVEIHTAKRMKGTGIFWIRERQQETRRFILQNGQSRRDFDRFLEPFH